MERLVRARVIDSDELRRCKGGKVRPRKRLCELLLANKDMSVHERIKGRPAAD